MLGAPRPVHEVSHLVVLALPEAPHAAMLAVLLPQMRVDAASRIERSDELVAMPLGAGRKLPGAGEVEPNALEHMRRLGHDRISLPRAFYSEVVA